MVIKGEGSLDTSALTGESVPQTVSENSIVLSGAINLSSVLYIRAEKEFYDSTVAKILDMVENASAKKAKAENFITRFARYYTPAVVITAVVLAILPPLVIDMRSGAVWISWLNRALTFLVISCPCALVISVPMSFFGGIGCASRKGILFKGTSYLELIDKANIFVFDKTGTLTKGTFDVKKVIPAENRDEILRVACIAESGSLHPIAKAFTKRTESPSTVPNIKSRNARDAVWKRRDPKDAYFAAAADCLLKTALRLSPSKKSEAWCTSQKTVNTLARS